LRYAFSALIALSALTACAPQAPVDNAAATSCTPGTLSNDAASVCNEVTLANGAEVVVPTNAN
jgi:hypothetical protein